MNESNESSEQGAMDVPGAFERPGAFSGDELSGVPAAVREPIPAPAPPPRPVLHLSPSRPYIWGLGRRKSAVARVRIKPGAGAFFVNGRPFESYFLTLQSQARARAPLAVTATEGTWDIFCNVSGGGPTGQADAVRMGLARALKAASPAFEPVLRHEGQLTRDSRMKERKKYGRRGARRGFQFSKR